MPDRLRPGDSPSRLGPSSPLDDTAKKWLAEQKARYDSGKTTQNDPASALPADASPDELALIIQERDRELRRREQEQK